MYNRSIVSVTESTPAGRPGHRFFYGYTIVIVGFIIMAISWGVYNSYGIFFNSFLDEFGWTRATISLPFSISMIVYGIMGFVVGIFNDRFGPRVVVAICGVIVGAGFMLMSQITALWQLYLFLGILAGVGMSGVWVPQLSTVARWFVGRRTLMTGIVIGGVSIGGIFAPIIISRLIVAYDWRWTYLMLGGLLLVVMVLAGQFLKRDPAEMGQQPYGHAGPDNAETHPEDGSFTFGESVVTPQFWLSFVMLFCLGFCIFAIIVHVVPHAIDLGFSGVDAANILAAIGGLAIIGNYSLGSLADRIGNRWVYIIGFILAAAALLWLMAAVNIWGLYIFAVVFALAHGGLGAAESPLVAGLFGLRSHGLIYGVVHIGFTIGAAAGPFVTGLIYDTTGSYQTAFLICVIVAVIGVVASAVLRPTGKPGGRI